ncbi:Cysteine-rich receptor-like protein kinase 25 [Gossypium arboreum]|uniref:Cysteine-rich receptor-like protein kinase 25 n=1 Tax=Gossypium arboreum TaxID=29729 RepID=A0A0B0PA34_GOSAR|nr:Cysteine-rich receptor-like protein kinase 25 [Gossypium arboreum]
MMMVDSFTKLFLVAVCLSTFSFGSLENPTRWYYFCSNATTLTRNIVYAANVDQLFSYLSTNATEHDGFFNTTAGQEPNMVYGLFLCRGDARPEICRDCINLAAADVAKLCPNQSWAIIWYNKCMLRYSNRSIFSSMAERPNVSLSYRVDAMEPYRFNRLVATVMKDIATRAPNARSRTKKFATKEATFNAFQTLYSLAQCTPDISSEDCYRCLQDAIADLQFYFGGKQSGFAMYPSCTAQYQTSPFYSLNQTGLAKPPVSPQHPLLLPPPPPPPPGKRGISSQTVIKIVVSTVGFLVLSCFLCGVLGWQATKKLTARKTRNDGLKAKALQSLRFDLSIIEAATKNFAEVNKIGTGGFGSVYKVWRQWKNGTPIEVMDSALGDSYVSNEVARCIHIALLCVQQDPEARPPMAKVVLMLSSSSVTLPLPQRTAFYFGTITEGKPSIMNYKSDQSTSSALATVNETSLTELFPR